MFISTPLLCRKGGDWFSGIDRLYGIGIAQGDDFDLDALLGDVGVDVAADAGSASPASQEAEVAEAFDDSMDAFAAEPAVEEASAEADPFAAEADVSDAVIIPA